MNTTPFFPASRLLSLALVCMLTLCFAACGGDNDEPSVAELLSEETTPIEFQLAEYYNRYEKFFLFDYAYDRYIGSDTISSNKCTVELRQGKHHLIWIKGLDDELKSPYWQSYGYEPYNTGTHYDPVDKTVANYSNEFYGNITYAELDLDVKEYLVPIRQVRCNNHIGGTIQVQITDMSDEIEQPRDMTGDDGYDYVSMYKYSRPLVGTIDGYPDIRKVSLTGNEFTRKEKTKSRDIIHQYHLDEIDNRELYIQSLSLLCPKSGINDIQLTATVKDKYGNKLSTTPLPHCSVQRGYTTVLRGPLFSGSAADWTVTMEPYDWL